MGMNPLTGSFSPTPPAGLNPLGAPSKAATTMRGTGGGLQTAGSLLTGGAGLLDQGISSGIEALINFPIRVQQAQKLESNLGPSGKITNDLWESGQNTANKMEEDATGRRTGNLDVLSGQRASFNKDLQGQYGYTAGGMPDPASRDPRNAVGRFNMLVDQMGTALSSNTGNKASTLGDIVNDIGSNLQSISGQAGAALQDRLTQIDATLGQTYGKDSPMYQSAVNLAKQEYAQTVGNQQRGLMAAYSSVKANTREAYDSLEQQIRTGFAGAQVGAGAQVSQEAATIEGQRQTFNDVERSINDAYWGDLHGARMFRYNVDSAVAQFAAAGLGEIANAWNGAQLNPSSFTNFSTIAGNMMNSWQALAPPQNPYGGGGGGDAGNYALTAAMIGSRFIPGAK